MSYKQMEGFAQKRSHVFRQKFKQGKHLTKCTAHDITEITNHFNLFIYLCYKFLYLQRAAPAGYLLYLVSSPAVEVLFYNFQEPSRLIPLYYVVFPADIW